MPLCLWASVKPLANSYNQYLATLSCHVAASCTLLHSFSNVARWFIVIVIIIQIIFIQHLPKLGDQNGSKIFWMTLDQNLETIWQGLTPKITLLLLSLTTYLFSFSRSEDDRESWLSCGLLELFVSKFFCGLTTCFIFNTNRKKITYSVPEKIGVVTHALVRCLQLGTRFTMNIKFG